jgi:UDP-N-acetyl-D-mannosaminuronic acid dehydrogenase
VTSDPALCPLPEVLEACDLLVIGAPHDEYRELATDRPVVDIWNLRGEGARV